MANEDILSAIFSGAATSARNRGPADIGQFEEVLQRNSPWRQAAAPIMAARFNTSTWNPATTLGVSLGQAFLGAALSRLGAQSEAAQIAKVNSILPSLYSDPSSVMAPEGVDSQAFEGLKADAIQQKMQDEAQVGNSIKNALAQRLIKYDPKTGGVSTLPGADNVMQLFGTRGGSDEVLQRQLEKEQRDQETKDKLAADTLKQSFKYVDETFDRAKKVDRALAASTMLPWSPKTKEAEDLERMGIGLTYQIDKIGGREVNDDAREQFKSFAPKWNDSEETLKEKQKEAKRFLASYVSPGAIKYIGTDTLNIEAPASMPTPEEARAELIRRGVIK